jgi:cytoskeletal protein CcmA (bactofilin family)
MGATYTRQSSSGITDGAVIEASDINAEFDQLLAAFVAASGHTHDGTAAEGGPVTKLLGTAITIGDATAGTDIAVTFDGETSDGVLTWMEDEDYFKFSDEVLMNSTEKLLFGDTGTYIYQSADGVLDLVSDTEIEINATTIDINGAVAMDGAITGATNITLSGELDAATLDISGNADIDGTLEADAITINSTAIGSIYGVIAGSSSIVTTGALDSGSITSGFGTIDTGSSTITTTGLISGGSLDIDNVLINGTTIGHTDDTDLLTLASGGLTVLGTITVGVDDTGHDIKYFGASAGAFALWNESENLLDLRGATAAGPGHLKLTTGELTVDDADILGRIDFQAPLETGSDAILVAASIWAEADDSFAAGVNNTDIVFATGKSETAAEKFRFTADNEIGVAGANYGTDGQVLTSGGAGAAVAWEDASSGTALTGSTNNTVVTVTGSSAIQGEANFTYDSTDAALTSGTSNKPVFSFTNTNTDANGAILKFIKDAGEAGAANDISGLISFYADDAGQNNQEFGRITGRVVDATAGGEEGALDFYVAEYDGTVTKGMEIKGLASDGNITVDISTHDGAAGGLMLAGTLVTSTATELNYLDGATVVIPGKVEGTNFTGSLLVGHATTGTLSVAQRNTGVGVGALDAITSGDKNTGLGYNALTTLNTGVNNTSIGAQSLQSLSSGNSNVSIGMDAGTQITTGDYNTLLGEQAGFALAGNDSNYNLLLGYESGENISSGAGNVIIGSVDAGSATGDRQLLITGYDGTTTTTWIDGDSSGNIIHAGTTHSAGGQLTTTGKALVMGF